MSMKKKGLVDKIKEWIDSWSNLPDDDIDEQEVDDIIPPKNRMDRQKGHIPKAKLPSRQNRHIPKAELRSIPDIQTRIFAKEVIRNGRNLLNPKWCNGKRVIPNILIYLGANKKIINNPRTGSYIIKECKKILENQGLGVPENPTKEAIVGIITAIQGSRALTENEIEQIEGDVQNERGISIDATGNVTCMQVSLSSNGKRKTTKVKYSLVEDASRENVKNVQMQTTMKEVSVYREDEDEESIVLEEGFTRECRYNPDGIEMFEECNAYRKSDETGVEVVRQYLRVRDFRNPFVGVEFDPQDPEESEERKINGYYLIKSNKLDLLTPEEQGEQGEESEVILYDNAKDADEAVMAKLKVIKNAVKELSNMKKYGVISLIEDEKLWQEFDEEYSR